MELWSSFAEKKKMNNNRVGLGITFESALSSFRSRTGEGVMLLSSCSCSCDGTANVLYFFFVKEEKLFLC